MVKQRSLGPDNMDDGSDASSAFLDALRTRAMDDLHHAALEYGIIMKDLGALGKDCSIIFRHELMESYVRQPSSTGSSRATSRRPWTSSPPVRSRHRSRLPYVVSYHEPPASSPANLLRRTWTGRTATRSSKKRVPSQSPASRRKSRTSVFPFSSSSRLRPLTHPPPTLLQTRADAEAYKVVKAAEAQAQRTQIEAEAQAKATRLAAEAEAEAIRLRATADAAVADQFAREMELRRTEVQRVSAFGDKAVFVLNTLAYLQGVLDPFAFTVEKRGVVQGLVDAKVLQLIEEHVSVVVLSIVLTRPHCLVSTRTCSPTQGWQRSLRLSKRGGPM